MFCGYKGRFCCMFSGFYLDEPRRVSNGLPATVNGRRLPILFKSPIAMIFTIRLEPP